MFPSHDHGDLYGDDWDWLRAQVYALVDEDPEYGGYGVDYYHLDEDEENELLIEMLDSFIDDYQANPPVYTDMTFDKAMNELLEQIESMA